MKKIFGILVTVLFAVCICFACDDDEGDDVCAKAVDKLTNECGVDPETGQTGDGSEECSKCASNCILDYSCSQIMSANSAYLSCVQGCS
ncbi:MAG: hypothetical protein GY847_00870 [Proteobacteria bacterium]|nr:hypothetical protein [Pseudomonadota bacterium]